MESPPNSPQKDQDKPEVEEDVLDVEFPLDEINVDYPRAAPSVEAEDQESTAGGSSLLPSTPLNRYLAEVRRYPFLSKE